MSAAPAPVTPNAARRAAGRLAALTCDVEIQSESHLGEFELLMRTLECVQVPVTFFVEYRDADRRLPRERAKVDLMLAQSRHELGLHVHWSGSRTSGIRSCKTDSLREELEQALTLAHEAGAPAPESFRSGGLCCSEAMLRVLVEHGFKVDSSVAAGLDEPTGWHQRHTRVTPASWYFPAESACWRPAASGESAAGLVEVPVTRLRPSWRFWRGATLQPGALLARAMLAQAWRRPAPVPLATVLFHSWGAGRLRGSEYPRFLVSVRRIVEHLRHAGAAFVTMRDICRAATLD